MLTEILIKPFIEGLEREGIEDTTPYEQGFLAGMAALSSILSENIDNQPQLFTYLGMAISECQEWVESQVIESTERLEKAFREFEKVFPDVHDQPQGVCKDWLDLANKLAKKAEEETRERQPAPSNAGNEIVSTEVYTLEEFNEKFKPFIEDLEREGIEDTTPYELCFMAGMASLSSILSDHIDNQPQLFVYLGMAISECQEWVESLFPKESPKSNAAPGKELK